MAVQANAKLPLGSVGAKHALTYARVSTPGQATERRSSLEAQERRLQEFWAAHGLESVEAFTDVLSGRRGDRAEYRRMVQLALEEGVDCIVVQWAGFLDRNLVLAMASKNLPFR